GRRQKKPSHPLVGSGDPAHSQPSRTKTYQSQPHHRMVTLAACSPSRSKKISPKTETTTVMLGNVLRRHFCPFGSSGGGRGTPGPTQLRAQPHQTKNDLLPTAVQH